MPFRSRAQRRLFYAAASGKKTRAKGLSPEEAKKFIRHSRHQKGLVEKVEKKLKKIRKLARKR